MNKANNACKIAFLAASALTLLSACAPIPIKRETAALNFEFNPRENAQKNGKPVAIVSPEFIVAESGNKQQSNNGFDIAQIMMQATAQSSYNPQSVYESSYKSRLKDAMMNSIQAMMSSKGFTAKGPYPTFDDIAYGDKKSIYLAAVPSIKVYFDKKTQGVSCSGSVCTDQGQFFVTGEVIYKMIEPLTGQTLMTKRINLSDFQIAKNYTRQFEQANQSGLIGMAINKATSPSNLTDNTDLVMTEALNEFFKKSMSKIDSLVSTEELLSFNSDINNLKGMKRF